MNLERRVVEELPAGRRLMPDRVIAATALAWNAPLVSRDGKIRAAQLQTIW